MNIKDIILYSGIYRHYKGGLYYVTGVGQHTETEEYLVFYKDGKGIPWARPLEMFVEQVEYEGKMVPRFEPITHTKK